MDLKRLGWLRSWFPIPVGRRGFKFSRWILLEGHRIAVTGALLSVTFASIVFMGSIWTFEMKMLLTETAAVQTILNSFLSGIILLVSIVVSINSIVLSHDITSIGAQEKRIESMIEFRRDIGGLTGNDAAPKDPDSFLKVMATVIKERAHSLEGASEDLEDDIGDEFTEDITTYVDSVAATAEELEIAVQQVHGGDLYALWLGLETDYGPLMNSTHNMTSTYRSQLNDDKIEEFTDLMEMFEMFATGREYFKTLYYGKEISELSRTLLVFSLPSIIVTIWAILAIDAGLLPDVGVFGLSPLLLFVALTFTVALVPFIILTSYMLRVATVSSRASTSGPFRLRS